MRWHFPPDTGFEIRCLRSEAKHVISCSRMLPTILNLCKWAQARVGLEPNICEFPSRQLYPLHQSPRPTIRRKETLTSFDKGRALSRLRDSVYRDISTMYRKVESEGVNIVICNAIFTSYNIESLCIGREKLYVYFKTGVTVLTVFIHLHGFTLNVK